MPGTNNFKVFNETFSNSQTDAQYAADAQRTSGVVPGVAPSALHNKFYRQVSVMTAAIAQVIANRGYNANDTDLTALILALSSAFSPSATSANVTYFVNTATGNDANDGLAAAAGGPGVGPLKTVQAAINRVPQIVNHTVSIELSTGTFDEDVFIQGFMGKGYIYIYGNTFNKINHAVRSFYVADCDHVYLRAIASTTTTTHGIDAFNVKYLHVQSCSSVYASTNKDGLHCETTKALVQTSEFSGRGVGISAYNGSNVYSDSNTGSLNTYGLFAGSNSKIGKKDATQPTGTSAEGTSGGGQIS